MSIDMAQFHQVFFEESFEGLAVMETGLLNLNMGDVDSEEINTIFRAAHSIKGGSGTFGFNSVADFTHVMETLLDEMRDGRRQVTQSAVDVLLGSVDCLTEMLTAIQNESEVDKESVDSHQKSLEDELNGASSPEEVESVNNTPQQEEKGEELSSNSENGWKISFCPHEDLLQTGNDPVRMFKELAELGELEVFVDLHGSPSLEELNPENCYLSWSLILKGNIDSNDIDDIFDWVEDECDLSIQPLTHDTEEVQGEALEVAEVNNEIQKVEPAAQKVTETVKPEKSPASSASPAKDTKKSTASSSIRVDTGKIDTLINMVGELVITQSMLSLVGEHFTIDNLDQLKTGLIQLERHTRELQESVMNIRMMPISFVFSRFPRLAHDLSSKLNKKIDLILVGEHTEVDKTVVELISDPLVHLVRNSLDHGIEMPADRIAAGKPETGTVTLEAYHRGGNIVIEVKDDGKGLNKDSLRTKAVEKGLIEESTILTDKQIYELIFMAGFSTAAEVTDVSGRGVGMDVVRRNIQALGGSIEITSALGVGSTMAIHLPLTLAILDGQSIAVGDSTFIVPLGSIIESVKVTEDMVNRVAGKGETFRLRDEYLPIVRMNEIFHVDSAKAVNLMDGLLVVVEGQGVRCGLFVDDLLGQQQVVIKSLETNYRRVEGVSSATILGDGSVALILDIPGLVRLSNQ